MNRMIGKLCSIGKPIEHSKSAGVVDTSFMEENINIKGIKVESSRKSFELCITLHRPYAEWLMMYLREPKTSDESIVNKDLREKLYNHIVKELQ